MTFFLLFTLAFSISFGWGMDEKLGTVGKIANIFFLTALLFFSFLGAIACVVLGVHKIIFHTSYCLITIGLLPCTGEMYDTIYASVVFSFLMAAVYIGYFIFVLIIALSRWSVFKRESWVYELIQKATRY